MELAPYSQSILSARCYEKAFVFMQEHKQFFYRIKSSDGHSFAYLNYLVFNCDGSLEARKKKFLENHRDMWKDNYSTATTTVPT